MENLKSIFVDLYPGVRENEEPITATVYGVTREGNVNVVGFNPQTLRLVACKDVPLYKHTEIVKFKKHQPQAKYVDLEQTNLSQISERLDVIEAFMNQVLRDKEREEKTPEPKQEQPNVIEENPIPPRPSEDELEVPKSIVDDAMERVQNHQKKTSKRTAKKKATPKK
jgi:hypothetical protein